MLSVQSWSAREEQLVYERLMGETKFLERNGFSDTTRQARL